MRFASLSRTLSGADHPAGSAGRCWVEAACGRDWMVGGREPCSAREGLSGDLLETWWGEMKRIVIKAGTVEVVAELNNSSTAEAIWRGLPITGSVTTWGEEIYFRIPVSCDLESSARDVLELGELGYWPPGRAFCIFFGKTPISAPGEIRAASAVTVVGQVLGDPKTFLEVRDGETVRLEGVPE